MCLLCRDYGRHQGHAHVVLDALAASTRQRLQQLRCDAQRAVAEVDEWIANVHRLLVYFFTLPSHQREFDVSLTNSAAAMARSFVTAHFSALRTELNAQERVAVETVGEHVAEKLAACNELFTGVTLLAGQVQK